MSEKERIEQIISMEGITSGDFAKEIGIQNSTISHIITERNRPSLHVMRKILKRYPNINTDWLILGQGEMLRDKSQSRVPNLFTNNDESTSESDTYMDEYPENSDSEIVSTSIKHEVSSGIRPENRTPEYPRVQSEDLPVYGSPYPKEMLKVDKKIERIIIYFTDNTYQEFESK